MTITYEFRDFFCNLCTLLTHLVADFVTFCFFLFFFFLGGGGGGLLDAAGAGHL